MGKLDTVEVNGPEGDVVDWDAVDWRRVEDDVRRLRHRIFTEGLLEPGASKRRTPGSEGAAAQQCAAATRQIETAYLEIKSSILGGRVLRARTPEGVEQEVYALLATYQLLRTAMTDATDSVPGLDPDRASFSTALNAARDQIIQAAGVITDTTVDLVGTIGRHILDAVMPDRRIRTKPRLIKRSNSKYQARGTNIDRTSYKATINIDILLPDALTTPPNA